MRHRLRVTRVEAALYHPIVIGGQPAGSWHPQVDALIRRYHPPIIASVLAMPMPTADGATIEWYSDLSDQPVPLTQLAAPARAQAEALLAERLAVLRNLAERMEMEADPSQHNLVQALRSAAVQPKPEHVFVIGGQPVVVMWGQAAPTPVVAPLAAAAVVAGLPWWRRVWLRWLILALLLLLLLGLLFGLRGCGLFDLPLAGQTEAGADLVGLKDEEGRLRDQAEALRKELRQRLESCPVPEEKPRAEAPPALPKTEITKPNLQAAPLKVEPKAEEAPKAEPKKLEPKPEPKPEPKLQPQAKAQTPPPQKQSQNCPPARQKWEAPEVVLLLDASGSMAFAAGIPNSEIEDAYRRASAGDRAALMRLKSMIQPNGKSRLDIARQSILETVPQLPSDVDVGLVVVGECQGADNYKFFAPNERGRLGELLSNVRPHEGTPLARGIERAANMMDGNSVPGVLIVVSDGDESCGGDPCAAARAMAQKKPNLKINFIDVNGAGQGSSACVVGPSGGKVYKMRKVDELPELVRKSSEQPMGGPGCKP
ncbi:VWA domain-containing protein [Magnetospirillum molischianum]|uniref:VWFA domain-containing protein n=1 Tax=Magnetospirillum molischianum DSM 120 TaxID=1150626 RepID=H8FWR3_MAGML|nr:VWA domain-containing protein [Magnetospirillum molischianum]CCG42801.1 conserved hypothetical protein [Magnetospirillum molischianum DSM 120]